MNDKTLKDKNCKTTDGTDIKYANLLNALSIITKNTKAIDAPQKTTYYTKHYQYTIGIGNDHIATLTIDKDALAALHCSHLTT